MAESLSDFLSAVVAYARFRRMMVSHKRGAGQSLTSFLPFQAAGRSKPWGVDGGIAVLNAVQGYFG